MSEIVYSVAIPVFNEAESVDELVSRVEFTMNQLGQLGTHSR